MKNKSLYLLMFLIFSGVSCSEETPITSDPVDNPPEDGTEIFTPISPVTGSIIGVPSAGTPFHGLLNSPGAVVKSNGRYYLFYNDYKGGWPPQKVHISYAVSDDLTTWQRHSSSLISGDEIPYLDGRNEHPSIGSVIEEEDGTFAMYFDIFKSGRASGIGRAVASSLEGPWVSDEAPILLSDAGSWDKSGISANSVVRTGGEYRMYYSVFMANQTNPEMAIGLATSEDGMLWTKYNDPATGDIFEHSDPVFLKGPEGSWDEHKVEVPRVVRTDAGWVMAYRSDDGTSAWNGATGYGIATSADGIQWNRFQDGPVIHENHVTQWATIWASAFLKETDGYYLFIETDGPPIHGTRINAVKYTGDFF